MALIMVAAVGLRLRQASNTVDDAYITYRYAANLAAGHGLVYNPGEAVLGTSSPGYALLLAPAAWWGGRQAVPSFSLWVNALADGMLTLIGFVLVRRLAGRDAVAVLAAAGAALLLAVDAKSVDFSSGGMEAPLFSLMVLSSALLLSGGRAMTAALVAGLSTVIRPDGGLLAVAVILALALAGRRIPWREMALAALPALAFGALAWLFYGDPLPASVRAKAEGVYLLPADHALRYLARHMSGLSGLWLPAGRLLPFFSGAAREYATMACSALLPMALMAGGWRRARRGRAGVGADMLAIYATLFLAAFAAGNPFMMGWYYVPLETTYLILMILGGAAAARAAGEAGWGLPLAPAARRGLILGLVLALLLVPQLSRYQWRPGAGVPIATLHSEWEKVREHDYLRVGSDLERLTGGRAVLAAPEIGALGWAYPGPVLDTVGLVSPAARRHHPLDPRLVAGNSGIPPDLIAEAQPDVVVLLEIFGRRGLLPDARFQRDYRLWRTYPSALFGSRGLLVFVRRSAVW